MIKRITFFGLACLLLATAAQAQRMPFWGAKKALPLETPPDSLRRGQFTWAPEVAPQGPMLVVVSLDEQRAYTYRNGLLIGVATVSTGKRGHATPTGVFTTKFKEANHHSNKYNNASMPYTQRITNDGVALHAGGLPGYPSSHGCIHLPSEYARLLFQASPLGMTVVVTNSSTSPAAVDHPSFLAPANSKGSEAAAPRLGATEPFRWQPGRATKGPLSIVVSRADQRLVVMRNGVEIGRSKVTVKNPADSIGTHILIAQPLDSLALAGAEANGNPVLKWMCLHFTDTNYEGDNYMKPLNSDRINIPPPFLAALLPEVTSGTSLVLTDAPILRQTTGVGLTLLTSSPRGR